MGHRHEQCKDKQNRKSFFHRLSEVTKPLLSLCFPGIAGCFSHYEFCFVNNSRPFRSVPKERLPESRPDSTILTGLKRGAQSAPAMVLTTDGPH
jgi:hypothetical protein